MSSWEALKRRLQSTSERLSSGGKRRRIDLSEATKQSSDEQAAEDSAASMLPRDFVPQRIKDRYVALDCEMVGIGPNGRRSALARCSLVNFDGEVLYDKHVRPQSFVTDFRTKYSGIRKSDLRHGKAIALAECQKEVAALIKGKVLVGHALKNDLDVLMLSHSRNHIRDTSTYQPYMRPHPKKRGKFKPRSLKDLTRQHLGISIQKGEHDPSVDARCAMMLYRRCRAEWEASLVKKRTPSSSDGATNQPDDITSSDSCLQTASEEVEADKAVASQSADGDGGAASGETKLKKRLRKSLRKIR